jgi:predicted XRE-type DNA-binding protein
MNKHITELHVEIEDEPFEIAEGSGNPFVDLGLRDPELKTMKALAAASIIGILDDGKITVRAAAEITGVTAADISRIRNADLSRFTIDRLIKIVVKLGGVPELKFSSKRAA